MITEIIACSLMLTGFLIICGALIAHAHDVLDRGDYRECRGFEA